MYNVFLLFKDIQEIKKKMAVQQSDIDALTSQVSNFVTTMGLINGNLATINTEIAALKSTNPSLDLSALQTAVGTLGSTINSANSASASDASEGTVNTSTGTSTVAPTPGLS